ncbi:MFS transporter, partial [Xanthomonas oryzae pv. oryzae]
MPTERPITVATPPTEMQPTAILAAPDRAATLGMVARVSLNAFESLAAAAAMPTVARQW